MATLAADSPRVFSNEFDPLFEELDVIATDIIYEGAAVGDNASGYMRPLVAGDDFRGFAEKQADNSTGSAGDIRVKIRRQGVVQLTVTGAAARTDVGKPVYASDDDTFTLTPTASRIGNVAKWVTSTTCLVNFRAHQLQERRRVHVVEKTSTSYTCVMPADDGKVFIINSSGAYTFTMPAAAAAHVGCRIEIHNCADQSLTLTGTAGDFVFKHDLAANSLAYSTASEQIGGGFIVTGILLSSTAKWLVSPLAEEAQTITVTT